MSIRSIRLASVRYNVFYSENTGKLQPPDVPHMFKHIMQLR